METWRETVRHAGFLMARRNDRLRLIRLALRLTQEALAAKSRVPLPAVRAIETGKRPARRREAIFLARAMNVPIRLVFPEIERGR